MPDAKQLAIHANAPPRDRQDDTDSADWLDVFYALAVVGRLERLRMFGDLLFTLPMDLEKSPGKGSWECRMTRSLWASDIRVNPGSYGAIHVREVFRHRAAPHRW